MDPSRHQKWQCYGEFANLWSYLWIGPCVVSRSGHFPVIALASSLCLKIWVSGNLCLLVGKFQKNTHMSNSGTLINFLLNLKSPAKAPNCTIIWHLYPLMNSKEPHCLCSVPRSFAWPLQLSLTKSRSFKLSLFFTKKYKPCVFLSVSNSDTDSQPCCQINIVSQKDCQKTQINIFFLKKNKHNTP